MIQSSARAGRQKNFRHALPKKFFGDIIPARQANYSLLVNTGEPKDQREVFQLRKYEVIFIIKSMEEEPTDAVIEKFSKLIVANGGTITKEDRWGKRRLAYEIKKESEGFYVLFYVTCEPACVAECDRVMKITDEILKHMIVRSDEKEAQE